MPNVKKSTETLENASLDKDKNVRFLDKDRATRMSKVPLSFLNDFDGYLAKTCFRPKVWVKFFENEWIFEAL